MELLNTFVPEMFRYPVQRFWDWPVDISLADSGVEQRNSLWAAPRRRWEVPYTTITEASADKLQELFLRARGMFQTFKLLDVKDCSGSFTHIQAKLDVVIATAGGAASGSIEISGDYRSTFIVGVVFAIAGSTGNDDDYTVNADSTYSATTERTTIVPSEAVADGTDDGHILKREFQLQNDYYASEAETWSEDIKYIVPDTIAVAIDAAARTEDSDYMLDDDTGIIIFTATNAPADGEVITAVFKFYWKVRFDSETFRIVNISPNVFSAGGVRLFQVKE